MIGFWKVNEPNGEFSNWWMCKIDYKGHTFISSEQAFMWEKAKLFGDENAAKQILKLTVNSEIKAYGRLIQNFDQEVWDKNKERLMYDVNLAKFLSDSKLKEKLLSTGNELIVECSPLDKIWGIGIGVENAKDDMSNWKGKNLLGRALMAVRETLRNR